MGDIVLGVITKYLESHPEVVEKLVEALLGQLVTALTAHLSKTPQAQ